MLHDITPRIDDGLKVWPGDTAPSREVILDLKRGDSVTLSSLHSTVHLGAHADAPSHYGVDGRTIDVQPLDVYVGECQLIRVAAARGALIRPEQITVEIRASRVLLATGTFPDPTEFNEDFAAPSPELIDDLHRQGVRLVGIDTPSMDFFSSKDLPTHQAFLRNDMAILEGLVLAGIPEGIYELIALPLKLAGFDGSPVRAILRTR